MKIKKLSFLLITALTVSTAAVFVNASIRGGPDAGSHRITNSLNNAVLTTDSRDPSYLTCAPDSSTIWNISEKNDYYLITTPDGKKSLEVGGNGYVFLKDTNETYSNQQWSILQVPGGGFTIQLKDTDIYLGFENNDLKTQRGKPLSTDSNYKCYIWNGSKATPSATPTPSPTPTPTDKPKHDPPKPATPTPNPTKHPTKPQTQLNQVVLKVTMNQLRYTVNGVPMMFDVPPYLDTKANRSMIPMRFIAEAFGADVTWNDRTKTQTIMLNGKTFNLTENKPLPDGMGTPVLLKDRFFVPLRYVSQELGASVDWDDATQTNTIIYYK